MSTITQNISSELVSAASIERGIENGRVLRSQAFHGTLKSLFSWLKADRTVDANRKGDDVTRLRHYAAPA